MPDQTTPNQNLNPVAPTMDDSPTFTATTDANTPPPPPIIEPQQTPPPVVTGTSGGGRRGRGKIIAAVLGILLLLGGVGAGLILVQQQQEIREKAVEIPSNFTPKNCSTEGNAGVCKCTFCDPTNPANCIWDETGERSGGLCTVAPPPPPGESTSGNCDNIDYSNNCIGIPAGCTVNITKFSHFVGNNPPSGTCFSTQNQETIANVSGPTTLCPGNGAACGYCVQFDILGAFGVAGYTGQCAETPTPPGETRTLPPREAGLAATCLDIKAYDTQGNQLTVQDLANLESGDVVRFAVSGTTTSGAIDLARFTINGVLGQPTSLKIANTDEFYTEYTVPAAVTQFTIKAELHHTGLNDWF